MPVQRVLVAGMLVACSLAPAAMAFRAGVALSGRTSLAGSRATRLLGRMQPRAAMPRRALHLFASAPAADASAAAGASGCDCRARGAHIARRRAIPRA